MGSMAIHLSNEKGLGGEFGTSVNDSQCSNKRVAKNKTIPIVVPKNIQNRERLTKLWIKDSMKIQGIGREGAMPTYTQNPLNSQQTPYVMSGSRVPPTAKAKCCTAVLIVVFTVTEISNLLSVVVGR